jgi:hypothetical protein
MSNLNTNKRKGKLYARKFTALIFTDHVTGNTFEKSFILFSNGIPNFNSFLTHL